MTDLHLDVTTEPDDGVVRLRLRDDAGRHLDGHAVRLGDQPPAMWEGLFDTRSHVRRYAGGTRFTDQPARGGVQGAIDGIVEGVRPRPEGTAEGNQ